MCSKTTKTHKNIIPVCIQLFFNRIEYRKHLTLFKQLTIIISISISFISAIYFALFSIIMNIIELLIPIVYLISNNYEIIYIFIVTIVWNY